MTHKRFVDTCTSAFKAYGTLFNFNTVATHVDGDLDGKAALISRIWRIKQL